MRSTRFYLILLALIAIFLCTSSKGATTTPQTLARHAATSGPRRLDLLQPVKGAQSRAQGLNSKTKRAMSRCVARSGQRSPDQPSSLSLSPSSSSHATDSSKADVPDLPTLVVSSDTQFVPRPAAALDLKPTPSHPGAETRMRSSPQIAKRCHYIGTFFRRSVFPLTVFAEVCLRGSEVERRDSRRRTALTATHPPIRHRSLTLMHPPQARFLCRRLSTQTNIDLASTRYGRRFCRFGIAMAFVRHPAIPFSSS